MFEKKFIFVYALLLATLFQVSEIMAQGENRLIRKGNKAFEESDYQKAEVEYRRALEKNEDSFKGEFNLGGALYQQENFDEAAKTFSRITELADETGDKAGAFYNLGNSLMNKQEYEAAIEAYKNALRHNPDDFNSKYNLEYAMHQLKEQQKQEQQQQNQDEQNQDQEQENKDEQNKQDNQQQNENEENDPQQQDNRQQSDSQSGEQQEQQQQNSQQISKEDAERMLQALREREKNTLDKIKREKLKNAKSVKSEKDW